MSRRSHSHGGTRSLAGSQGGFTLLEVMIAVVIMSVGLLGMALLQSTSLRAAQTTNERSQATMLVYGMMDMVRANRGQAIQYSLVRESAFFGNGRGGICAPAAPAPGQRWAADRNEWVCAVRRAIPGAVGRVTVAGAVIPGGGGAATPATIEVRLEWCDARGGALSGTPEFAPILGIACAGTVNVILARSGL